MSEADVILPPPTSLNPIPSLPAALRLDNQEQLLQLLLDNPLGGLEADLPFRQLLVFETESLRTLLLRQVLSDPHTRSFKGKQTKKNWDALTNFPLPKALQTNIVGTRLLSTTAAVPSTSTSFQAVADGFGSFGSQEVVYLEDPEEDKQHIDVITYLLRPWNVRSTQAVASRIRSYGQKKTKVHHRLVYLPQPTALLSQVLQDLGLAAAPNISVEALQ